MKLSLPFQLHEKNDGEVHDSEYDDEPTGNKDVEQVQEDSVGGDSGEGDPNGRAVESEDENPEASKRYWEVKWKKEGVRKVDRLPMPLCFELCSHAFRLAQKEESRHS